MILSNWVKDYTPKCRTTLHWPTKNKECTLLIHTHHTPRHNVRYDTIRYDTTRDNALFSSEGSEKGGREKGGRMLILSCFVSLLTIRKKES